MSAVASEPASYSAKTGNRPMKSRIRGGDAARAAADMAERRPVPLQPTEVVGPFQPVQLEGQRRPPPRVQKPSSKHDVIYAPTHDLHAHRAALRTAFGETCSDQFVDTMMGKLISGLRPNPYDVLEEATLNAALAVISSFGRSLNWKLSWRHKPSLRASPP